MKSSAERGTRLLNNDDAVSSPIHSSGFVTVREIFGNRFNATARIQPAFRYHGLFTDAFVAQQCTIRGSYCWMERH